MKQLIRESLCDGCNGAKYGLPCNVEDRCEEFQKEMIKLLNGTILEKLSKEKL